MGVFDGEERRGSTSDTVDALKGKLVLNILENFNPESDLDSMLVQIQQCLNSVFQSKVCLLLARCEEYKETRTMLDMMQNVNEGEMTMAKRTLEEESVVTNVYGVVVKGVVVEEKGDEKEEATLLAVPVFRNTDAALATGRGSNPIQVRSEREATGELTRAMCKSISFGHLSQNARRFVHAAAPSVRTCVWLTSMPRV